MAHESRLFSFFDFVCMICECSYVTVSKVTVGLTLFALAYGRAKEHRFIFSADTFFALITEIITIGILKQLNFQTHVVFSNLITVLFYCTQFLQAYCCFALFSKLGLCWSSPTLVACILRATITKCAVGVLLAPIGVLAFTRTKDFSRYLENMRQIYGFRTTKRSTLLRDI